MMNNDIKTYDQRESGRATRATLEPRHDPRIMDEEVLIKTTFGHNPQAGCEILFQKYYAMLCSHAVRLVYSREVAEDIVSEIFCKFWSERIDTTIRTSFRAYLFKAVRYSAYNYIRWELSRKDRRLDTYSLHHEVSSLKADQLLMYEELAAEIGHIISDLPQQCRRVFVLSRFENKKYAEIAAELNISVKAVEAHISKALDILRKSLKAGDLPNVITAWRNQPVKNILCPA